MPMPDNPGAEEVHQLPLHPSTEVEDNEDNVAQWHLEVEEVEVQQHLPEIAGNENHWQ